MLIKMILAAPAQTTNYMIAGYAVIFSVMIIYIGSLLIRNRNLRREIQTMNELEQSKK
jgi:hypothetical protein